MDEEAVWTIEAEGVHYSVKSRYGKVSSVHPGLSDLKAHSGILGHRHFWVS
jgi:hypothetical protein